MSKYTKEFDKWWSRQATVPYMEAWQYSRVKDACFKAWLMGRKKLRMKEQTL